MPERNGRARSEQIRDSLKRMGREFEAVAASTAAVEQFNPHHSKLGDRRGCMTRLQTTRRSMKSLTRIAANRAGSWNN
jgi:hypothetical protein